MVQLTLAAAIFNIFTPDVFQFVSFLPAHAMAVLFIALALHFYDVKMKPFRFFIVTWCLTVSLLFYQSWAPLFVPLCLIIIFRNKAYRAIPVVFLIYILAAIADLISIRFGWALLHVNTFSRVGSGSPVQNIISIINLQPALWLNSLGISSWEFLAILIIILAAGLTLVKQKKIWIGQAFTLVIVVIALAFLPHVLTDQFWPSHRSLVVIAAIPGIILLTMPYTKIKVYATVALLVFQLLIIWKFGNQLLMVNREDQQQVSQFISQINNYEKDNNIRISTIAYGTDASPQASYPFAPASYDLNARATILGWAFEPLVKFVSHRYFNYEIMTDAHKVEIFGKADWTEFTPDEEIVFKGDKAYILWY